VKEKEEMRRRRNNRYEKMKQLDRRKLMFVA